MSIPAPDEISMEDPLCDSSLVSMVTLDYVTPLTVAGVRAERSYRDYEDVSGESTEFEWNIFPGFTSLQLCDKISNLLSSLGQSPETFTGRILFMSMFNDISCDSYDNKDECLKNAEFVKTFAKRFGIGHW